MNAKEDAASTFRTGSNDWIDVNPADGGGGGRVEGSKNEKMIVLFSSPSGAENNATRCLSAVVVARVVLLLRGVVDRRHRRVDLCAKEKGDTLTNIIARGL